MLQGKLIPARVFITDFRTWILPAECKRPKPFGLWSSKTIGLTVLVKAPFPLVVWPNVNATCKVSPINKFNPILPPILNITICKRG
jgi:hypothetical protein